MNETLLLFESEKGIAHEIAEAMFKGMKRLNYTQSQMIQAFDEFVGVHQACRDNPTSTDREIMLLGEVREKLDHLID